MGCGRSVGARGSALLMRGAAACVLFAAALVACSNVGGEPVPSDRPSIEPTSASALPTVSPNLPEGVPSGAVALASGQATLAVTGALQATVELPISSGSLTAAPPDPSTLIFRDDQGNTLAVSGILSPGESDTSDTLFVSIAIQGFVAASSGGECRVSITGTPTTSLHGSVRCEHLTNRTGSVRVDASFIATA